MNAKRITTPMALLLVVAMGATPLIANEGDKGDKRRQENGSAWANAGRARRDGGGERSMPGSASDQGRRDRSVEGRASPDNDRGGRYAVPRSEGGRGDNAWRNRDSGEAPRRDNAWRNDNRADDARRNNAWRNDNRADDGRRNDGWRNDNRAYDSRRYDSRRVEPRRYDYDVRRYNDYRYSDRRYDSWRYDGRRYGNWYSNRSFAFGSYHRTYRPGWLVRFGLGFSIYAGSPFVHRFDYRYTPPYAYRYPMRTGVAYGGVSFLIDPDDAEVYIDGTFVGIAREFGGQPIPVAAGYHRIELYAPGYEGVVYDITVMPGQVIPYRGSLVQEY